MRLRSRLILFTSIVIILVALLSWWLYFFIVQDEKIVSEIGKKGIGFSALQLEAVRSVTADNMRMFLFESAFLILLIVGGFYLLLRSMRSEVLAHRQQRDLLSAVTHELKSPVSSAKLYIQSLLLGRVMDEEKKERYLQRTEEDLDRLDQMIERLLESARINRGKVEVHPQPLDLSEVARRVVKKMGPREDGQVDLDLLDPLSVQADPTALEIILRNLIANAFKYGGDPARVLVRTAKDDHQALLEVRDFGQGLRDDRAEKLFQPFVRGENELVRSQPGVGLGLYLVSEFTQALGGSVRAKNAEGGGFLVQIRLPFAKGATTERHQKSHVDPQTDPRLGVAKEARPL